MTLINRIQLTLLSLGSALVAAPSRAEGPLCSEQATALVQSLAGQGLLRGDYLSLPAAYRVEKVKLPEGFEDSEKEFDSVFTYFHRTSDATLVIKLDQDGCILRAVQNPLPL